MRTWWKPEPFNYLFMCFIIRSRHRSTWSNSNGHSSHHILNPNVPFTTHTCQPLEADDSTPDHAVHFP